MYQKFFVFFILLFISTSTFANEKVLFVVDLIRHGDRTPIHELTNDAYDWKQGLGELTPKGEKQEFDLGRALRQKYVAKYHFLPELYEQDVIYVRSTNIPRTIKSAQAFLAGLYPLKDRPSQQPIIPVHIMPLTKDRLLVAKPDANIFSLAKRYVAMREFWRQQTFGLEKKLDTWSSCTGLTLDKPQQISQLADNLYIRKVHGVAIPKCISKKDAEKIIALGDAIILNEFKMKSVAFPMGKEFLKTVLSYMEAALQQKTTLKYVLLSGHDSSIMSVMTTLGLPLDKLPTYASHLSFMLTQDDQRNYISVIYNGKPLRIPGCAENHCTINEIKNILKA